jgi:hypothetical protein
MTIGRLGPKANYPERQALYPVSVRHTKCLPTASFRSPVARDTLAFGYKIPVITALLGLEDFIPRTLKIYYMPGTLNILPLQGKAKSKFSLSFID